MIAQRSVLRLKVVAALLALTGSALAETPASPASERVIELPRTEIVVPADPQIALRRELASLAELEAQLRELEALRAELARVAPAGDAALKRVATRLRGLREQLSGLWRKLDAAARVALRDGPRSKTKAPPRSRDALALH